MGLPLLTEKRFGNVREGNVQDIEQLMGNIINVPPVREDDLLLEDIIHHYNIVCAAVEDEGEVGELELPEVRAVLPVI